MLKAIQLEQLGQKRRNKEQKQSEKKNAGEQKLLKAIQLGQKRRHKQKTSVLKNGWFSA